MSSPDKFGDRAEACKRPAAVTLSSVTIGMALYFTGCNSTTPPRPPEKLTEVERKAQIEADEAEMRYADEQAKKEREAKKRPK